MSLDFVAEMGWKSAVVSGAALLVLAFLRSRSAVDRAAVVRLGVLLLLLLPLISTMLPSLQVEQPQMEQSLGEPLPLEQPSARPASAATVADWGDVPPQAFVSAAQSDKIQVDVGPAPAPISGERLLMLAYLAGVSLVAARLLAGLWTLRRWTLEAEDVTSPVWRSALRRARAGARVNFNVRLLVSGRVSAPMSWGLREPVILIDAKSLARPEDADAILNHEMAHIARKDWLMLMLSRLAVAIFWFNPLVWLLERTMVQHAEEAADLHAISRLEPTSYAMTLVTCFCQTDRAVIPANSIAAGRGLTRRIAAILDDEHRGTPSGSLWTAAAMVACVAIAAPTAALEFVPASYAEALPHAQAAPRATVSVAVVPAVDVVAPVTHAAAAPAAPVEPVAPPVQVVVVDEPAPAPVAVPVVRIAAQEEARAAQAAAAAAVAEARAAAEAGKAAAEAGKAAAVAAAKAAAVVDVDTLVAMKINGVDAAYLREIAAIGPRFRGMSADELIAMKIHDISPAKLRQYADLGYGNVSQEELIGMAIQDVTPAYIREMASAGYRGLTPEQLMAMRIHDVDADLARRANGAKRRLTPDELIEMAIMGDE